MKVIWLIFAAAWVYVLIQRYRLRERYLRQGWAVIPTGRDSIKYKEREAGADRDFELFGDTQNNGRVLWIPSEERWNRELPSWAAGRRNEILERIKSTGVGAAHKFEVR